MGKTSFHSMEWSWKELLLLLFLVLVMVPIFIENILQNALLDYFQNSLYSGTLTGFIMAIIFTAGVYFIALKPFNLSWRAVGLNGFSKGYWKWILWWTIVLIVVSIVILIIMDWLLISHENTKTESLQSNLTWMNLLIGFISAAIISPIYEEIFYRGFLYKWFRVKWGVWAGIIISSTIFTIVHIPTYNTLPVNFISSAIFAWTYEKSGSILPAIIIHGIFNGIAVLLTAIS